MTEQLNQKALDRIARALGASQPCDPRDLAMQVEVLAELRSKRDLSTATLLEALRVGYEARERGAMLAEVAAEFLRAVPEAADPTREVVKVLKRANYCTWAWAVSRALELLGVPPRHSEPAERPRPEWIHVHIPVGHDIRCSYGLQRGRQAVRSGAHLVVQVLHPGLQSWQVPRLNLRLRIYLMWWRFTL